jgi:hypothetical protein
MQQALLLHVESVADVEPVLWEWLLTQSDLRGCVTRRHAAASPNSMGTATEIVVALTSGGTLAALAHALEVWLINRRSDVVVTVTMPTGLKAALDARRIKAGDAQTLLEAGLKQGNPPNNPQESAQ